MVLLLFVVVQFLFYLPSLTVPTFNFDGTDMAVVLQKNNEVSNHNNGRADTVHILYCLHGNRVALFEEFAASLRSVLLNAPTDAALHIHVMANTDGIKATQLVLKEANITGWKGRNPTQIILHDVQPYQTQWKQRIEITSESASKRGRWDVSMMWNNTIATYYKLFINEILLPDVNHIVYFDTDVIQMAPLDKLWNSCCSSKNKNDGIIFFWGEIQSAGFMVLSRHFIDQIWDLFEAASIQEMDQIIFNDQTLLQAVQRFHPNKCGLLPPEWDVHAVGGTWEQRNTWSTIANERRTGANIMHFNGGKGHEEAFWNYHEYYNNSTQWKLAGFYVDLPWVWAKASFAGSIRSYESGYPVQVIITDSMNV